MIFFLCGAHPFSFCIQFMVAAGPETIQAVIGQEAGYTPDRLPIYGRISTERQETIHPHTFTPIHQSPQLTYVFGLCEEAGLPERNQPRLGGHGLTVFRRTTLFLHTSSCVLG